MEKTYKVLIDEKTKRQLEKLDKPQRVLVIGWIRKNLENCQNPYIIAGAKALAGIDNGIRYRVGSYRILCTVDNNQLIIRVFKVGHRSSIYRNL